MDQHQQVVAGIRKSIIETNHTRSSMDHRPPTSLSHIRNQPNLNNILKIDLVTSTVWVEPNVTMEALVQATFAYGLVPAVVGTSKKSTVGESFAGTTNESSSFLYGTFDCTVLAIEVILSNGELVFSSVRDESTKDLLFGSAGALDTLGLTTMFEIALIEAGPYIELTYRPVGDALTALKSLEDLQRDSSIDYMEGILFSSSSGAVITGRFSPRSYTPRTPHFTLNSFFRHVRFFSKRSHSKKNHVEYLPSLAYFFRHDDRCALETSKKDIFSPLCRQRCRTLAHADALSFRNYGLPNDAVDWLIKLFSKTWNIWPVLMFPVRPPQLSGCRRSFGIAGHFETTMWNVGLWGPSNSCSHGKIFNSKVERLLLTMKGFTYLHHRAPCSQDTVWAFHDDRWYSQLRSRWKVDRFPDITERIGL
jgi:delta24-sterol reductase